MATCWQDQVGSTLSLLPVCHLSMEECVACATALHCEWLEVLFFHRVVARDVDTVTSTSLMSLWTIVYRVEAT